MNLNAKIKRHSSGKVAPAEAALGRYDGTKSGMSRCSRLPSPPPCLPCPSLLSGTCSQFASHRLVPCLGTIYLDGHIYPSLGCPQRPDEDPTSSSRPSAGRTRLHLDNEARSPSQTGHGLGTPTAGRCPPCPDMAARRPEKMIKI